MDRETAKKVLAGCHLAFEPLNAILLDRSPELTEAEFLDLRHRVADTLGHMFELLIEPVIREYPDLNPY